MSTLSPDMKAACAAVAEAAEKMPGESPLERARLLRTLAAAFVEAVEIAQERQGPPGARPSPEPAAIL